MIPRDIARFLLKKGWTRRQDGPKEPWFYKDPLKMEVFGLRADEAYALQLKRDANSVK